MHSGSAHRFEGYLYGDANVSFFLSETPFLAAQVLALYWLVVCFQEGKRAWPAGLALDCVSLPTGTGAVPVPRNPEGSTAGVNTTAPLFVATRCDSAPAYPVDPPQATPSGPGASAPPG